MYSYQIPQGTQAIGRRPRLPAESGNRRRPVPKRSDPSVAVIHFAFGKYDQRFAARLQDFDRLPKRTQVSGLAIDAEAPVPPQHLAPSRDLSANTCQAAIM